MQVRGQESGRRCGGDTGNEDCGWRVAAAEGTIGLMQPHCSQAAHTTLTTYGLVKAKALAYKLAKALTYGLVKAKVLANLRTYQS